MCNGGPAYAGPLSLWSFGNSGESSSDLEKKIAVVPEALCHSLDHLDLVIDTFEDFIMKRPEAVG
jgi:hypothetical protein